MSSSNSFVPEQILDRIVAALRDEPIPDFEDPFVTDARTGELRGADDPAGSEADLSPTALRLRTQLAEDRTQPSTPVPTKVPSTRSWIPPGMWWHVAVSGTVAMVFAVLIGLALKSQPVLAEVATAVLERPWVHLRTVNSDKTESEAWYSPSKDITASRSQGDAKYEDFRLHIYHSYHPAERVLYRGPIVWTSQAGRFESMVEALKVLVQTNSPRDQKTSPLDFFGSESDKLKVIDQRVDKVAEQDQNWLDCRMTVKYPELTEPVRLLFRVNAKTKLPALCRIEGQVNNQPVTREVQFDYPETGPVDIYDLGVPKTAKFVDRVPAGDLKLIVESLKAGRERMDPYRAVFVKHHDDPQYEWWTRFPEVLSRKGDRYRRDCVVAGQRDHGTSKPAADVDLRKWWFERTKLFQFLAVSLQLGQTSYTCQMKSIDNPDGSKRHEIATVRKHVYNLMPGDIFPVDYVMRPEYVCRPPMGLGNEQHEPTLDMHPAEGPPGCILLTVRTLAKKSRVQQVLDTEQDVEPDHFDRYWLDPQRDYIAMRWEMVTRDQNGKETITSNHTMEEVARSPQGVWYATKIRLKKHVTHQDGTKHDTFYQLYVDFDAELPDSLFETPTPGSGK